MGGAPAAVAASMAGLPTLRPIVSVGPPLLARDPRPALTLRRLPVVTPLIAQVAAFVIRLKPSETMSVLGQSDGK